MNEILSGLTEVSAKCWRCALGKDGTSRTLEEVGRSSASRERIRQIEAKALRKLRHPNRSRKLRDYLG
jgi:RNA polymerase primary sigma factor